ncbi:MAG: HlyC/CorC family transporter [Alphaproteobacteria bacterium]|nr:HlyC/CorC family transporter [Alphaproteobacteria bacterium]
MIDTLTWLVVGLVFVLMLISAFFSASETGLTAASRARLHHLGEEGSRRARLVQRLIADREKLIGTILIGNNLVNILASALTTSLLIRLFGDAGVAYATIIMTVVIVLYGEIMPKSYAIRHPERIAMRFAPAMRLVVIALSPITFVMTGWARLSQRLLGLDMGAVSTAIAREELRGAFSLHARHGGIVKDEQAMLDSILDLDDVEVGQVMTHRRAISMIDVAASPAAVIDSVLTSGHTRMPVYENDPDNVIGVIHAKDVLRAVRDAGGRLDRFDLRDLAQDPWFVPDTTTLRDQLEAFRRRRIHFALVVDEYGSLMGLITLEDVLEEIVGEIDDEHDVPVPGVTRNGDGSYTVDGTVPVRDLNREFDWRLPEDEAATVAGLVIHEARQIPTIGQAFVFHGFKFEILARQRNQVTSLRLTPPIEPAGEVPTSS